MASRVLGLVRDMVFAAYFGTGGAQDAFVAAFKIPNFLRRLSSTDNKSAAKVCDFRNRSNEFTRRVLVVLFVYETRNSVCT